MDIYACMLACMPLCVSCHSFVRFMFPRSHVLLVLGSFAWLLRDLLSDGRSRWRPPRNWKFIREAVIELVTRRLWVGNLAFRRVSASSLSGWRQHRICSPAFAPYSIWNCGL